MWRYRTSAAGSDAAKVKGLGHVHRDHSLNRGNGEAVLPGGLVLAIGQPLYLGLPHPHRQQGFPDRPAASPSLEDHGLAWPHPGGPGRWRGRRTAGAATRRSLRVHVRHPARDPVRHHGGDVSHGNRERNEARSGRPGIFPRQPARHDRGALAGCQIGLGAALDSRGLRAIFGTGRAWRRLKHSRKERPWIETREKPAQIKKECCFEDR